MRLLKSAANILFVLSQLISMYSWYELFFGSRIFSIYTGIVSWVVFIYALALIKRAKDWDVETEELDIGIEYYIKQQEEASLRYEADRLWAGRATN